MLFGYVLDLLITSWLVYGIWMLIYFSDDLFTLKQRREAQFWGLNSLFAMPIILLAPGISLALTYFLGSHVSQPVAFVISLAVLLMIDRWFRFRLSRKIGKATHTE